MKKKKAEENTVCPFNITYISFDLNYFIHVGIKGLIKLFSMLFIFIFFLFDCLVMPFFSILD